MNPSILSGEMDNEAVLHNVQLPPNIAEALPEVTRKAIMADLYNDFILPQLMERKPYEGLWDNLLDMYRINMKKDKLRLGLDSGKMEERMQEASSSSAPDRANVSDTLIYDAVDRLKNLCHFVSWKDGPPVQYNASQYYKSSKENEFYHPLSDKLNSANGLLQWNITNNDVYRKHLILSGHHYLYGCSFLLSELDYQIEELPKRAKDGSVIMEQQIYRLGVTFEPISIRKLWINYRLCTYDMDEQPCPFFYEIMPRFKVLTNVYEPTNNPFGFVNLNILSKQTPTWLLTSMEVDSFKKAVESRIGQGKNVELTRPEFSAEALWTFYPMLPLDSATGDYKFRKDGKTAVPLKRFIIQTFGSNLLQGQMIPVRIQENFYPMKRLPLYASVHMPDMDSGAYGLSIGEVLTGYYEQICTALNQWVDNKNLINNPPSTTVVGSPAMTREDRNDPGANIPVIGENDVKWRQVYDASNSTVSMLEWMRDRAQTTSKAVDAVLGKALGGRTSATEAQNVFQAAMSGVTTDINLFNYDIMGGYANRVWEMTGLWFSPSLIRRITGQYGEPLTPEDMNARVGIKWDVGSSFIESIVKQGHLRYALEAASRSPALRQDILWREFFKELKMPTLQEAVIDNGFAKQVQLATEQTINTYLGKVVMVNPNQDHNIAIEVKSAFLEDTESSWSKEYGQNVAGAPSMKTGQPTTTSLSIIEQIQLHQYFAQQQLQQQLAMQQMQAAQQIAEQAATGKEPKKPQEAPKNAGQVTQQNQGR